MYFKEMAVKVASSKSTRVATGWGAWFASSWVFDDLLYPAVIAWLGPVVGGSIMASLAIMICWIWIKKIVASDSDWFGMEVLRKISKIVFWIVRITRNIPFVTKTFVDKIEFAMTFLAINIVFDPMIAVLYFRHGDTAKILTARDRKFFAWSAIFGNTYWIIRSWGVVVGIKFVWKFIQISL